MVKTLPKPFRNHLRQLRRTDRLGHVVVVSRGERSLLVARHCFGGQGHNGDVSERRIGLDLLGRVEAVHDRQLNVHKDQVGVFLAGDLNSLAAVDGFEHLRARWSQQGFGGHHIVGVVLDHEDLGGLGPRGSPGWPVGLPVRMLARRSRGCRSRLPKQPGHAGGELVTLYSALLDKLMDVVAG